MEDDVIHNVMSKRGCHLGMVPELAAARNSSTLLTLDHDLGTSPEMGRRLTVADPIRLARAELPRTATLKVQRIELSRRLHGRLGERRDSRSVISGGSRQPRDLGTVEPL
jgi:hypothetical protein